MTPEDLLDQIEALLAEERVAIRQLDGRAIDEAATRKEALFSELRRSGAAGRKDLAPRLHALIPSLRRNIVLLAHARNCLHDVLVAFRGEVPQVFGRRGLRLVNGGRRVGESPPVRLSMKG